MAVIHGDVPEKAPNRYGEYRTGKWLTEIDDDDMHLWFALNYLKGVGDIDILLGHPQVGFSVIEIKGNSIRQIEGYSRQGVVYTSPPNKRQQHPAKQAHDNSQRLKSWLVSNARSVLGDQVPKCWVHSAPWWPNILREEWLEAFADDEGACRDAEMMLFTNEMDEFDVFLERIRANAENPMFGQQPPQAAVKDTTSWSSFLPVLDKERELVRPKTLVTTSSSLFPEAIRPTEIGEIKDYFDSARIVFRGHPGTGKTVKLLEVGFHHLQQDHRVLYTCYNKTLASEVRREVNQRKKQWENAEFLAMDLHQLRSYLAPVDVALAKDLSKAVTPEQVDGAIRMSIRRLAGQLAYSGDAETFDLILVDEAQDFPEEGVDLLEQISDESTAWAVSYGIDQELYPPHQMSEKLLDIVKDAEVKTLRRNFRHGSQSFFVSQAFREALRATSFEKGLALAHEALTGWVQRGASRTGSAEQLSFDFDDFVRGAEIHFDESHRVEDAVLALLRRMATQAGDVDGLIIFGGKNRRYQATKTFLGQKDISYLDLVDDLNRRIPPGTSSLRLTTAHSARGLTADFVLVFDFDYLCGTDRRNQLSTIVLSRARKQTHVAPLDDTGDHLNALKQIIAFEAQVQAEAR
jgi:hypothetical protein